MRTASNFDDFEASWRNLADGVQKTWIKLTKVCKNLPGAQQWLAPYRQQHESDQLLVYVFQTRNADQHTLEELLEFVPGKREFRVTGDGFVRSMVIEAGTIKHFDSPNQLQITDIPARAKLLPIVNRGVAFEVPSSHLGAPLADPDPGAVAIAAFRFYERAVNEAEERFR